MPRTHEKPRTREKPLRWVRPVAASAAVAGLTPPTGWRALDADADMLPYLDGHSVKGLLGVVPVTLIDDEPHAVVIDRDAGTRSLVSVADWTAETWEEQGAKWVQRDAYSFANCTLNYMDSMPLATGSGMVWNGYEVDYVTSVAGGTLVFGGSGAHVPFTIYVRYSAPGTPNAFDRREHRYLIWGGYVREEADGFAVHHYDEMFPRAETDEWRLKDAGENGLRHGAWYDLRFDDSDVMPREVRRGTPLAYQGSLHYFTPFGAKLTEVGDADVLDNDDHSGHDAAWQAIREAWDTRIVAARAEKSTPPNRDALFASAVVLLLLALIVISAANAAGLSGVERRVAWGAFSALLLAAGVLLAMQF